VVHIKAIEKDGLIPVEGLVAPDLKPLFLGTPDMYHGTPDSGDFQLKSKGLKKSICDFDGVALPDPPDPNILIIQIDSGMALEIAARFAADSKLTHRQL